MKLFSALHHFYAMSTFPYVGCSRTAYLYSIYYNVRAIFYLAIQTLQKVILRIFIHPFIHPVSPVDPAGSTYLYFALRPRAAHLPKIAQKFISVVGIYPAAQKHVGVAFWLSETAIYVFKKQQAGKIPW
jgi:hypothetical protein